MTTESRVLMLGYDFLTHIVEMDYFVKKYSSLLLKITQPNYIQKAMRTKFVAFMTLGLAVLIHDQKFYYNCFPSLLFKCDVIHMF